MLSLPVALILGGGYVWLSGGRYEETENANLHQARMLLASDLSGRVVEAETAENRHVKAGDLLFRVDPEPYRIALAQADAAVAANSAIENIGARRLQTVLERVLEETSFKASDLSGQTVAFDGDAVREKIGDLAKNADLSRFIL